METTDILFALLRHVACGEELNKQTIEACTPENLEAVYALAKKHDFAHLVAHAVEGLELADCEVLTKLKNAKLRAIYRYARMDFEFERLCQTLEEAQIPFIPLKGSVIRQYYPEPWMRTSGDIDVLVKEEDFECAIKALEHHGWVVKGEIQFQNICMYSSTGVLLELHFNIRVKMTSADILMDSVWQYCAVETGKHSACQQTNEFFMCHQLAHMAKHVLVGGCGIRAFLDIWLLNQKLPLDLEVLQRLCQSAQLDRFYAQVTALTDVWFGQAEHTQVTENLERYILDGGVYGNLSNKVLMSQVQVGGKLRNFLHRMFVPYAEMQIMYPVLKKRKWLLPIYHVVRWCQVVVSGRMKRAVSEMKLNQRYSDTQIEEAKVFMESIGLQYTKEDNVE